MADSGDPDGAIRVGGSQNAFSALTTELMHAHSQHRDPLILRSKVKLRIGQLERETQALKRVHNDTIPSCRSPPEVLAEIFLFLAASCRQESRTDISWVGVTHVCQRWRDVSLHFPGLWCDLPVAHPEALETFLNRSKNMPISVKYTGEDPGFEQALATVLASDTHRLSYLKIVGPNDTFFKTLSSTVRGRAPILKKLTLVSTGMDRLRSGFLRGGAPALVHIHIEGFSLEWDELPIDSNSVHLQRLRVYAESGSIRPSHTSFMGSLHQLSSLRVLDLEHILPNSSNLPQTPPPSSLTLPVLASLTVSDSIERIQQFLDAVSIPAASAVELSPVNQDEYTTRQVITAFKKSCRGPSFSDEVVEYEIDGNPFSGHEFTFRFRKGDSQNLLSLRLFFRRWAQPAEEINVFLRHQFEWTSLHKLRVSGGFRPDEDDWRWMFGSLPKLRQVVFSGIVDAPLLTLLTVLKTECRDTNEERGRDQDATPWFPALNKITRQVSEFSFKGTGRTELLRCLADAVSRRSEARPPLELHIIKCRYFTSNDKAIIEDRVPKLKLVWHGWLPYCNSNCECWDGDDN